MAQQARREFGYQIVQLIKTEPLGTGSYGAVYKAMCDDLPCAGKILHPTLFQSNDPGSINIMRRFQQECMYLSAIRHPNIVQYLGVHQDTETQLPVLLMELMNSSLTRFLEQSQEPLSYHTQVDICHDIALALAYLHSNDIIHRDLSSNNVLLIGAGNRAKVSDFGMAKLFSVNRTTMTPLTMCPGTLAYMSPEALDDPPVYTKKIDTFSFGVLDIQIITRQFPDPGPRMKKIRDPRFPLGEIQVPVSESERRKSHIDLINPTHPHLPIATNCLNYREKDRPSAQELCHRLAALKQASLYGDSVQQGQERSRSAQNATGSHEDRERQIRELQQQQEECYEQTQDLRQQLQVSNGCIQDMDAIITAKQEEIQQLRQVTLEKDRVIEAREGQLRELNQQLAASEQQSAHLQQNLLQRENRIHELQEELQHLQQKLDQVLQQVMVTQKGKRTLIWKTCKPPLYAMCRGTSTVCGNMAYFAQAGSSQVHSYNSDTEEWFVLPECHRENFTLTVVSGRVTAVGGRQSLDYTNTLISFKEKGERRKWVEHFPPMPTKRAFTAVMCKGKALVVAGGKGEGIDRLTKVEIMDTDTLQWSAASSLLHPLNQATATVCGDRVYLVGGCDRHGYSTNSVLTCSLSALLQSRTIRAKMETLPLAGNHIVWHTITDLPVKASSSVTLNEQLLVVGGYDSGGKDSNNIYTYNTQNNSWEVISHLPTRRYMCLVAVLPGSKLMVVGGETDAGPIDKVEIATLK